MGFRAKPAAAVRSSLHSGSLNLIEDCIRAKSVANGDFKFTVTSPYTLSRTLLDNHYGDFDTLTLAVADVLAEQVKVVLLPLLGLMRQIFQASSEHGLYGS